MLQYFMSGGHRRSWWRFHGDEPLKVVGGTPDEGSRSPDPTLPSGLTGKFQLSEIKAQLTTNKLHNTETSPISDGVPDATGRQAVST